MELYTLAQMNNDFENKISNIPHSPDYLYFNDPYHSFFYILNKYGFRFNELVKSERFVRMDANTVKVPLSKGQDFRLITGTEEEIDNLLTSLVYYDFFYYVNNSTASELLQRFLQKKLYLDTGKSITTHYFRHKLCKNMFASGKTIQEISAYIGEVNLNNVSGYVSSTIMYNTYEF
jgi:hypothetical protein